MKLEAIYQPKGRAREYAEYALNLSLGCTHGCKYCYVPAVLHKSRGEFHAAAPIRPGIFEKLERDLKKMQAVGIRDQVLMSFTTDPYCTGEMAAATRRAMETFVQYDVPFQVLTKASCMPSFDFELYRDCDSFGTSLTFSDASLSRRFEPGATTPDQRILNLKLAKGIGIYTWVSFEPVIDEDHVIELFSTSRDFVDLYKIGKMNHGQPHGVADWGAFGRRIMELCERYGKAYYIKRDLAEEMRKR